MKRTKRCWHFAVVQCFVIALTCAIVPVKAAETGSTALDPKKLEVAKHLTDWLQQTLLKQKASVAIVARKGGNDVKGKDWTGMAHAGIAVYDPRVCTWIVYQLLNNRNGAEPTAELWRTAPLDFFYAQTGYDENALVLIPDLETQQRMYDGIIEGKASKLLFTHKYNLLSRYDSRDSLNCNKWILMNVAAARSDDYNPDHVLATIHDGFEPGKIHMNFIEKEFVKRKGNVRRSELPSFGSIATVTPQSLYESGLFPQKIFRIWPAH